MTTLFETILTIAILLLGLGMVVAIVYLPYWAMMKLFSAKYCYRTQNRRQRTWRSAHSQNYSYKTHKTSIQTKKTPTAYDILGCKASDNDAHIKKQYRTLVKQYHPDQLGLELKNESILENAKIKMQQINDAYEAIKKVRGLKR